MKCGVRKSAKDRHSYMRHIRAKGFLDWNFNLAVIKKLLIFQEIGPNLTYSQKAYFQI